LRKAYLGAAVLALTGLAIGPALAAPGHPAGGDGTPTHCTTGSGAQMDGVITWTPTTIWPPNHKMQDIKISYTDNDNDNDTIGIAVTDITNNQTTGGVEAPGSGHTGTDWTPGTPGTAKDPGTATTTPQVRSERSGSDGSRIYTITVMCTESGSSESTEPDSMGTAQLQVTVPHDQGHRS
jgi:hypothetical protein